MRMPPKVLSLIIGSIPRACWRQVYSFFVLGGLWLRCVGSFLSCCFEESGWLWRCDMISFYIWLYLHAAHPVDLPRSLHLISLVPLPVAEIDILILRVGIEVSKAILPLAFPLQPLYNLVCLFLIPLIPLVQLFNSELHLLQFALLHDALFLLIPCLFL
jgi:hypothetical protein